MPTYLIQKKWDSQYFLLCEADDQEVWTIRRGKVLAMLRPTVTKSDRKGKLLQRLYTYIVYMQEAQGVHCSSYLKYVGSISGPLGGHGRKSLHSRIYTYIFIEVCECEAYRRELCARDLSPFDTRAI